MVSGLREKPWNNNSKNNFYNGINANTVANNNNSNKVIKSGLGPVTSVYFKLISMDGCGVHLTTMHDIFCHRF
jgi:hypothetical protein